MTTMKQRENFIKMGNLSFGIDSFLNQAATFKKVNFGLVTNNVATTSTGILSRIALLKAGFYIRKLFSPEHGLTATGEDGAYQSNSIDSITQLPIISLYSNHLMPSTADMADIDMLLFDIPDVGSRFYTYLWTMTYVMETCAIFKKPFIILDRPNPISGNIKKAEGPMLDEKNCSSFLGRWNIPVRHSCSLGELATYFAATRKIDIDLTVFQLTNWNRNQLPTENNWTFTPTSPAIASIETALCYPGTGLLEGINVNEGRGTNTPFTIFGAPWINSGLFVNKMIDNKLPGVSFLETQYTPSNSLYAGQCCHGLSLSITDENIFLPVQTGITIIQQLFFLFPGQCSERLYKTVANPTGEKHLDKLLGVQNSFTKLREGNKLSAELHDKWEELIAPFLLYH